MRRHFLNQEASVAFLTHRVVTTEVLRKKFKLNGERDSFLTSVNGRLGTFEGRTVAVQWQESSSVLIDV